MDEYKASTFSGLVASPPLVGNIVVYFLFLSLHSPYVSTVLPSSRIFDCGFPAPHCWHGICHLWITVFFSSTVLSLMPLSYMLFCVSWIMTGNETGSPIDFLGAYLDICGTITSSLNYSPRSPLNKSYFHGRS